jgi:hypothetical protein
VAVGADEGGKLSVGNLQIGRPARCEQAGDVANRPGGILDVLEHVVRGDQIERPQPREVAFARHVPKQDLRVDPLVAEVGAGQLEQGLVQVHAGRLRAAVCERDQESAVGTADVQVPLPDDARVTAQQLGDLLAALVAGDRELEIRRQQRVVFASLQMRHERPEVVRVALVPEM